ncbi:MAG: ABC transporter ATP-binding protein [Firmicutes bacterium]|jgi:tungstate transport system ATP-binding protein|nr:ABC transporter ATP-binding protein [Bacillota bacterium]
MEQPLIRAEGLVQVYGGRRVLDIADLRVNEGDVLGILGKNGSGKSTLLRILCLLEKPTSGEIRFRGKRLVTERERLAQRRRMSMVFQEPVLFGGSVRFNVSYGLSVRRLPRERIREATDRVLGLLGIAHLDRRQAGSLSGGEARRVSLARALAVEPEMLFLDEPMANLDSPTKLSFARDLARVLRELRSTAVYVTHEAEEALSLCNRVVVMNDGRVVQDASPRDVWSHPAGEEAAALVGMEHLCTGVVVGRDGRHSVVRCGDSFLSSVDAAGEGRVRVWVRPEDVIVVCGSGDAGKGRTGREAEANFLPGVVTEVLPAGAPRRAVVDCGAFRTGAMVGPWSGTSRSPAPGDRVRVRIAPEHVHLIQ